MKSLVRLPSSLRTIFSETLYKAVVEAPIVKIGIENINHKIFK